MQMIVRKPTAKEIQTAQSWGTWSHDPGEFPWQYNDKETCYILAGKAEVTDKAGNKITFTTGDWVEFEQGLTCTWKILETIRKHYMFG